MSVVALTPKAVERSAEAPPALVAFRGIAKSYEGTSPAVRYLDLDVRAGEFLTLLGPSGSGKTTTLMMLAGFEAPTSGTLSLGGRSLSHTPPHKRDIGMVFQNYALFPHMTVSANVAYPLKVRKMARSEIEAKVGAALATVQMDAFGGRYPAQLSGGQQQRVALARALVFAPKLVLMDEPLGALDKQLRERMQHEIRSIHDRLGLTTVYVTHDQSEAMAISDRIAIFRDGGLEQIGTPHEIYRTPTTLFAATFVGENNCLDATVEQVADEFVQARTPDGGVAWAVAARPLDAGASIKLAIRPELLAVHPAGKFAGVNGQARVSTLGARVLDVTYLGDHSRLRASCAGIEGFMIKLPADCPYRPGDHVAVSWNAADARAFAANV